MGIDPAHGEIYLAVIDLVRKIEELRIPQILVDIDEPGAQYAIPT